jgi:hypothetical protein
LVSVGFGFFILFWVFFFDSFWTSFDGI